MGAPLSGTSNPAKCIETSEQCSGEETCRACRLHSRYNSGIAKFDFNQTVFIIRGPARWRGKVGEVKGLLLEVNGQRFYWVKLDGLPELTFNEISLAGTA